MKGKPMNYPIGSAYDRNPARIQILAKRAGKTSRRRRVYQATLISGIVASAIWAAGLILH
jgi:hypothetical protein